MTKGNLWRALILVPLLGVALVLMSGCGSKSKEPDPNAVPGTPAKIHVHVKLGNPGTDYEQVKIINAEDDKTMKERETVYRDKHVVHEYFAPDGKTLVKRHSDYFDHHTLDEDFYTQGSGAGTVKESTETFPGGQIPKLHSLYNEQGQLVSSEQYRPDKTLSATRQLLDDGTVQTKNYQNDGVNLSSLVLLHPDQTQETSTYKADGNTLVTFEVAHPDQSKETTTYRADGVRLFSVESLHADKTKDTTYYRADGTTFWAKIKTQGYNDVVAVESYKPDGALDFKRVVVSDDTEEVTVYGGTVSNPVAMFKQVWKNTSSYSWSKSFDQLVSVEQYRSDGKTVEKLYEYHDQSLKQLRKLTSYEAKGGKVVKTFRAANGFLEKEETYDATGKLTKTENVDEAKAIREQVNARLEKMPDFEDPSAYGVSKD